ncbi:MAG: hypothetical protein CL477_09240 [Acidobacteria bacterium]|jgi:predicted nucleic acid-binding protein|nr:hypothetical protein [Acidobacteriota bacterium]MDP7339381.1 type II toxin-antitoxin system VapC family toxin [Vicinamibacterales bacterium]MDP7478644.1 type II toxin-antitoxin system VapC family toxin [Vicinamibacterales bacterium]MDP7692506.1 type II toxin-antitoxin system VapC family toxin [Vicinamibacterales bacterium]HJN44475.1 type II toxin-antitoxin system VapC family toxin [Vicinamibacterales bacterium]|tara:strand:+ start:98 stop:529 length:432 start_codon:yes stop_codon:yes gene_type:complete
MYFDAAYIAKCYLNEPGAERVRDRARQASGLCSADFGRLEFTCIVQRHRREGRLIAREARQVFQEFEEDEQNAVWRWLPVSTDLVRETCERVRRLPSPTLIRTGDALHLACARAFGFKEVYTNDRRMLAGASHFGLTGVNLLE